MSFIRASRGFALAAKCVSAPAQGMAARAMSTNVVDQTIKITFVDREVID
jgi:hypothetical protein